MSLPDPNPYDLSTYGQPPPASAGWPPAARWAVGCGSGCAALILLQGLLAWAAVTVFFSMPSAAGLKMTATAPPHVTVGEQFPLTLTVVNNGDASIRVDSVVARTRSLSGVQLRNPVPKPQSSSSFGESQIWSYNKRLAKGERWTVRFDATASREGESQAALEVQANWEPRRVRFNLNARPAVPR